MFTPKYPPLDTAPAHTVIPTSAPAVPCDCGHNHTPAAPAPAPVPTPTVPTRPTVQLTPGSVIAVAGAGTAVVLVVGTVLVSMLLAVAITGASVAVCAVVLRSLLKDSGTRR